MEYNYLGASGLKVSSICLGTMTMGQTDGPSMPGQLGQEASCALLDRFVELGGNFIDTADVYSGGKSEQVVGTWLAAQPRRKDLVIATKLRFPTGSKGVNDMGLSRKHILASVDDSLARLQTDYIDLLQVHCWDEGTPLEETLRALQHVIDQGKVHYIGVSNFTGWQLQKWVDTSKALGVAKTVSMQAQYSLLCRWTEWEAQAVCEREGIALLPWSPLKGGWLTGKFKRDVKPQEGSRVAWSQKEAVKLQSAPNYESFASQEQTWELLAGMEEIAKAADKSVPQVALRWCLQRAAVPAVVIGAKKLTQLEDNLGAAGWELSAEQMQQLADLSTIPVPYPYEMVWRCQGARKRGQYQTL